MVKACEVVSYWRSLVSRNKHSYSRKAIKLFTRARKTVFKHLAALQKQQHYKQGCCKLVSCAGKKENVDGNRGAQVPQDRPSFDHWFRKYLRPGIGKPELDRLWKSRKAQYVSKRKHFYKSDFYQKTQGGNWWRHKDAEPRRAVNEFDETQTTRDHYAVRRERAALQEADQRLSAGNAAWFRQAVQQGNEAQLEHKWLRHKVPISMVDLFSNIFIVTSFVSNMNVPLITRDSIKKISDV
jgi:hypothetical protein